VRNRNQRTDPGADEPDRPAAVAGLRRSVLAETVLGVAVLAVTAVLVATTPGHTAAHTDAAHDGSTPAAGFSKATLPNGDAVEATVVPDRLIALRITDHHGQRVQPEDVRATASLSERGIEKLPLVLSTLSTGVYRARQPLPFAGSWRITVTVRTSALDAGVVTLSVRVR
jgi:copper transport protein